MPDGLDAILRLVAEGRLSAEEAAPLVEAMLATEGGSGGDEAGSSSSGSYTAGLPAHVRVLVTERGRPVVNLRVPLALGKAAVALVPGLSLGDASRIDAALAAGRTGPLLDVTDDNGDGVRVVLE
jgi:hypothetical protein